MQLEVVINQILVLFLIIFAGYIINKRGLIDKKINDGLSLLLTEITMPALVINSIISVDLNPESTHNLLIMTVITLFTYLLLIILANLFTKILGCSSERKTVFKFLLIFANVGYMGIPVIGSIYHETGIMYVIINNIFFNILLWTYGIYIFSTAKDNKTKIQWEKLKNNGLFAIIIGFFLLFSEIKLGPITEAVKILGDMTFPLSMLIIGGALTNVSPENMLRDKYIFLQILFKLIILPLIGLLLIHHLPVPKLIANINILMLAMPAGTIAVIFARKYHSDYEFASEGIFFTTLFSLLTIPLFIWLINIL